MIKLVTLLCMSIISSTVFANDLSKNLAVREKTPGLILINDMNILNGLTFKNVSTAHMLFFGGSSGADLKRFITKSLKYPVEFVDAGDDNYGVAYVQEGVLYITSNYFLLPTLERLSVLLHEARHLQGDAHPHIDCGEPSTFIYKGTSYVISGLSDMEGASCDRDADGAYAISYVFLTSVANSCTNCASLHGELAWVPATDYLKRIQNAPGVEALVRASDAKWKEHEPRLLRLLKSSAK